MKQSENRPAWWKESIVYQIYPRSFQDSNGDGIGDLKGIISRLDYVKSLGINVIWLNPICASPNDDNGYDISDYRQIMGDFGTMEDFDLLVQEVHARDLRLILDLVVNHTSDEHPWFIEARTSRSNAYYSYYHWWPAEQGQPPLRLSFFDEKGDAWRYNPRTKSYYLHYFSRKQPDLNWENPEVRQEIYAMMKFWLNKGIDGFRMDSITYISKDIRFPEIDPNQYPGIFEYYAQGPYLHEYLHEMNRAVLSKYNIMTVGEGSGETAEQLALFVEPAREELDMLYGFGPSQVRNKTKPDSLYTGIPYSLIALKKMFTLWDKAVGEGWPAVYLGNHDQPRMLSRFGNDSREYREISAKMLTTFLLTMRGTPYWYAGDEIGMCNIKFDHIEDYKDINTKNLYKQIEEKGGNVPAFLEEQKQLARDNARTPFQWNKSPYAGFSTVKPWLKVNPDYCQINVENQEKDPFSVLNYFRELIKMRQNYRAFVYGKYILLDAANKKVFSYLREEGQQRFLVTLNFSPKNACVIPGMDMSQARLFLSNYKEREKEKVCRKIKLRPYEANIWKWEEAD
ncbi:alpha-glucosidase [uncultured Odoribacter sp.]|uniref:glycoside hydrolase family 13 protein n=1 Tax=uncultured Odoribacter sp. TaxID=876416 RepID=UPI00261B79FC|nr:alpha-glucosidase [uncultured Odoribacter sp.]